MTYRHAEECASPTQQSTQGRDRMASTPNSVMRIPPELVDAARDHVGDPEMPVSTLVRTALFVLAGLGLAEALARAQVRPGPKPKA
jgi:hypothetical protein